MKVWFLIRKCFRPNNHNEIVFNNLSFQIAVEPSKSIVCHNLEEIEVSIRQVKAMLEYLMEITPRGHFHDAVDRSMQGAYWLAASIKNLDHNTGYASQVPVNDYFDDIPSTNIPAFKKRKVSAATVSAMQCENRETFEESFSPLGGHSYPYDCYKVNIHDDHYNTKGTGSLHPPHDQCHCGFVYKTQLDKDNHVTLTHPGGVWQCDECGKHFKDKRSSWKHFRTIHDHVFVHYCTFVETCNDGHNGTKFGSEEQSDVWWHMDKKHGLTSPLGCPMCEKKFASKQSQKAHISKCGTLDKSKFKTFVCQFDTCRKRYMDQCGLDKHMKIHTNDDPIFYICPNCGDKFTYPQALKRHMGTQHKS